MTAGGHRRSQPQRKAWQHKPWPRLFGTALTLFLVGGAVAFVYHTLSQPGRLPLRVVEVKGDFRHLETVHIERSVIDAIDGGFFSCDMQKLRTAVLEIPWVEDVSIRRVWPDKLSMLVTEQVPLARWGEDALISVRSRIFRPASLGEYAGLVKLSGPAGSADRVVVFYQAIVSAARARDLSIREVQLDERRHWWVRFADGLTLSLGREDIENRLAQFFRVYPKLIADPKRRPERVDMRYAHGFAVRWLEPGANAGESEAQDKV
ncbi:MAG: cell division protein FtsQ/DivIB [Sedimenticolaceae bacterium]